MNKRAWQSTSGGQGASWITGRPSCCRAVILTLILLLAGVRVLQADPISYIYAGVGSGMLGASSFTNSQFQIVGQADTDNITSWPPAANGPQNSHISTSIAIAGLGTYVITTPAHSWMNGAAVPSWGGLGKDHDVNWITLDEAELIGYGLDTPLKPVFEPSPLHIDQFSSVSTSGGSLTFTSMYNVSFTAVIPETSTAVLSVLCVAAGAFVRKRTAA
jgi:hypothetical protein